MLFEEPLQILSVNEPIVPIVYCLVSLLIIELLVRLHPLPQVLNCSIEKDLPTLLLLTTLLLKQLCESLFNLWT